MKRILSVVVVASSSLLCFMGCSSSTTGNDAGTDSGTPPVDSGSDAAGPVNGCTTFTDDTADGGTVTGPSDFNPSQYTPNCVHIKVGQSVTIASDFTDHPLAPFGGDTGNPIVATGSGTTVTFTFPAAGTFGFHCAAHPSIMNGAVEVK